MGADSELFWIHVESPAFQAGVDNGYLMAHPGHPPLRLSAAPAQFDDELPAIRREGPGLGQHSREVLAEVGYLPAEVEALVGDKVVITPD